ncbi:DUF3558 domain-containing protein [Nocardia higoensis]|uniref:DUF3558 domain-containing protein n=1 Tax=Nocardia higoensis TaxID=228599 RepID=A0ABS0D9U1_9NOCA|nr:DUF3558 domain-containing protein [Nocardia higoensis]MBF6353654.1 DUF3558 domain-containing protein [Nocardia higoensis]
MRIKSAATVALSVVVALLPSACNSAADRRTETPRNGIPASFDPCKDVTPEFIAKYGFDTPLTPFGPAAVIGPHEGKGCRFDVDKGFNMSIAVADAELGDATKYDKLVYRNIVVGGKSAEVAYPQDQSDSGDAYVSSESCELNVEIPDGLLTFFLSSFDVSRDAPEPCDLLVEIATEVVTMLPGG